MKPIKEITYHFHPVKGWINDPNGFVYFRGQYHLFYQYYAEALHPVHMAWGHAVSDDLLHWQELPTAILPKESYDSFGVWSGSALVKDDTLYCLYASVRQNPDQSLRQTISLATSKDGVHFSKSSQNPLISPDSLQGLASTIDFRDPYLFRREGKIYLLIGSHNEKEALMLLYQTEDLVHYRFLRVLSHSSRFGTMFECPSYFKDRDQEALIFSPMGVQAKGLDYWNANSSVYSLIPKESFGTSYELPDIHEIDHGSEFYAPQMLNEKPTSTNVLIAWANMWGRRNYFEESKAHFAYTMTLPRECTLDEEGRLHQHPINALALYEREIAQGFFSLKKKATAFLHPYAHAHLSLVFEKKPWEMRFFISDKHYAAFSYDPQEQTLSFSRIQDGIPLGGFAGEKARDGLRKMRLSTHDLELYFDGPIVEVYSPDGEETMSLISFAEGEGMSFYGEGKMTYVLKTIVL